MKRALVCGAGGFIGGHLVKKLKREGYWVRGVDIKHHEFAPTQADEFLLLDLREPENCRKALTPPDGSTFDEVYQLAADMGGMGFISVADCEVLQNNALINLHMAHTAAEMGVPRCGAEEQRSMGAEERGSRGECTLAPQPLCTSAQKAPQHPCSPAQRAGRSSTPSGRR